MESPNGWAEKGPLEVSGPTLLLEQGHPVLAVQHHVQVAFGCLQGGRMAAALALTATACLLLFRGSCVSECATASSPVTGHHWKGLAPSSLLPHFWYLHTSTRSPSRARSPPRAEPSRACSPGTAHTAAGWRAVPHLRTCSERQTDYPTIMKHRTGLQEWGKLKGLMPKPAFQGTSHVTAPQHPLGAAAAVTRLRPNRRLRPLPPVPGPPRRACAARKGRRRRFCFPFRARRGCCQHGSGGRAALAPLGGR